jgi:flagellar biosynthesis/type III secretory pathway protein FliH
VHPSDAVFLRDIKQSEDIEVQIVSDPRLSRGSVRAVMGDAIIESIKEKRIDSIVKLILGSYKESKK